MKPLEINVISDIHYYPESSGSTGKAYEKAAAKSQKLLHGTAAALEDCFDRLSRDESADIVLVSGDVTNNGEKQAHEEVISLLNKLKANGKRVFVITATHDFRECGFTAAYDGNNEIKTPTCRRDELFELYRPFGPDEAIAVHKQSMSYVVQLADGYRLFALNDDSNLDGASGFSDECFSWIAAQVEDAKKNGQFIIAMTHHPLISPTPVYALIGKHDMMGGWYGRRQCLADMGVNFIITGHTHIQDISYIFSEKGNVFYDITAASPVGYPGTYRRLVCDAENNTVKVSTVEFAKQSQLKIDGVPLYEALQKQLTGMISDVIAAAATDKYKFASMATAFSIKEDKGVKIGALIRPAAKWINTVTVGRIARMVRRKTGLSENDLRGVKDERALDFVTGLVMNLFAGDGQYSPDTPQYKITCALLEGIDGLASFLHIPLSKITGGTGSLKELVIPLLYNSGICDREALLHLDASTEQLSQR
ncbi:MAG: metallophosphoesterase [Clostridia bacterium]|nr:metallophosphoesterase [Clostridia bacterium]